MTSQGFPESYKESLRVLHAEFPSWVFQVQNTGLDWNDAVNNESIVGANLGFHQQPVLLEVYGIWSV